MANKFYQNLKANNPELPNRIGVYWSDEEETKLIQFLHEGKTYEEIGSILERTSGSIKSRLNHIVRKMYDKNISNEEISKVTTLSIELIQDIIKKHNNRKINTEKIKEDIVLKKEPVQAKLITIPQSDIMEMKLIMFEMRDLLRVIANQYK